MASLSQVLEIKCVACMKYVSFVNSFIYFEDPKIKFFCLSQLICFYNHYAKCKRPGAVMGACLKSRTKLAERFNCRRK